MTTFSLSVVCMIMVLSVIAWQTSAISAEHMSAGDAELDAKLDARVNDLEHTVSTMSSVGARASANRDDLRALRGKLTAYIADRVAQLPRLTAKPLAAVAPSEGQVFPGSSVQPRVWMDGSSYLYGTWVDKTGNGNNARCSLGVRTATQKPGETGVNTAFVYVRGGVGDSLEVVDGWPAGEYTFVHVTRYDGAARNRIWNGKKAEVNWLSGHHGSVAGRVHHNAWLIKSPAPAPEAGDWLVVVDTINTVRVNMGKLAGETTAGVNPGGAAINGYAGAHLELSDWAVAEVIVFEGKLAADDVLQVERYLHAKYGIAGFPAPSGAA